MKPKHHRTLCKGCKHGLEHHKDRGPCTYGHNTVTGGCLCPAFNTPASKIPEPAPFALPKPFDEPVKLLPGPFVPNVALVRELLARDELREQVERARAKLQKALDEFSEEIIEIVLRGGAASTPPPPVDVVRSHGRAREATPPAVATPAEIVAPRAPAASTSEVPTSEKGPTSVPPQGEAPDELGKGERACLNAIVRHGDHGCTEAGLFLFTGYKGTSRATYVKALRGIGLVETTGGVHFATEDGIEAAGELEGKLLDVACESLIARMADLGPGELTIFRTIGAYGRDGCSSALLRASVTSLKETSRITYLKALRSCLMVETVHVDDDVHRLTPPFLAAFVLLPKEARPEKPSPAELRTLWKSALPQGEGAVFRAICEGRGFVSTIMNFTSYKETSVRTYAKALKKRGLIVSRDDGFDLAPELRG